MAAGMAKSKRKKRRKSSAFYDLNVSRENASQAERVALITTALQLGYSGIAFNHLVKGSLSDAHLCKSRSLDLSAIASAHPDVVQSAHFHRDVLGVSSTRRAFRQYNRLTLTLDTAIQASAVNAANPVVRSYDIIAIRPTSQKVFDQACTHLEVDLISLDLSQRMPIRLTASSIQAALERGVFFEVSFSGVLQDVKARRELFANAQILQGLTRGRNIIFTSGAVKSMDLRGPNDVVNLATLFGLSREAAKLSLSKNCEDAIVHALARKRTYKSTVIVEKIPDWELLGSDETWFEVPKVWDPLSNAKIIEDEFLLPEKMPNIRALEVKPDDDQHVEEQQMTHSHMGPISPMVQGGNSEECAQGIPDNDKEGFLSINLTEALDSSSTDGRKNKQGGLGRKAKHFGKPKKRKR